MFRSKGNLPSSAKLTLMEFQSFRSILLYTIIAALFCLCSAIDPPNNNGTESKSVILPPCQACRNLVNSFIKGIEHTSRGKFEGGDADWEESRLGNYATSEVRLVEIQERICSDVIRGQNQCHSLAEAHESLIEQWWFKKQKSNPSLLDWLCISQLKTCCPDHHYGHDCKPCPGFPGAVCGGNGKCKGSGTRKGNGQCVCENGYVGELCQDCANGYFVSYKDEEKLLCSPCHTSCRDICTQAGPKGCIACGDGWARDTELGCIDIDECILNKNNCKRGTFCVNSPGSYKCIDCDRSCKTCHGDGPDQCDECAEGYLMKNGLCSGTASWEQTWQGTTLRYLTYVGLCISTCIILQRNTTLAALVGFCVAAYISLAEYSINWTSYSSSLF